MKMGTTTTNSSLSVWLFMALVFGFLCQDLNAGVVQVKQGKPKNSTIASKEVISSTPKPSKHGSKVKTTTTTTSTTPKPKQDTTTVKPSDLDLDGRHAFINNHFVEAQEEPIQNTEPLYDLIQKQMESVLSNTGLGAGLYADSPQGKEVMGGNHAPGKPLFSYNMNQFHDYDEETENGENEEDLLEQEEQQPDNCEDTEESLAENEQNNYDQTKPPQHPNPGYNQNKPSYSSINRPYNSPSSGNQDNGYGGQGSHYHQHNQKPTAQSPNTGYGQPNESQQTHKPSQEKPKPSHPSKPSQSTSAAQHKPQSSQKPSKLPATGKPPANSAKPNKQPIENGSFSGISTSPFSTSHTNNSSKHTGSSKRHLTFRTVSSSTQFVSTPIADLMLKFSIGMAKPAKSPSQENPEGQVYDKNDIELSV